MCYTPPPSGRTSRPKCVKHTFYFQQAKDMVMDLIRDQGFREQRGEYGSRMGGGGGGGEGLDVSVDVKTLIGFLLAGTMLRVSPSKVRLLFALL